MNAVLRPTVLLSRLNGILSISLGFEALVLFFKPSCDTFVDVASFPINFPLKLYTKYT